MDYVWFTTLTLIGAWLLAVLVIARRHGVTKRLWPLYVVLVVLCIGIGTTWPTGAA